VSTQPPPWRPGQRGSCGRRPAAAREVSQCIPRNVPLPGPPGFWTFGAQGHPGKDSEGPPQQGTERDCLGGMHRPWPPACPSVPCIPPALPLPHRRPGTGPGGAAWGGCCGRRVAHREAAPGRSLRGSRAAILPHNVPLYSPRPQLAGPCAARSEGALLPGSRWERKRKEEEEGRTSCPHWPPPLRQLPSSLPRFCTPCWGPSPAPCSPGPSVSCLALRWGCGMSPRCASPPAPPALHYPSSPALLPLLRLQCTVGGVPCLRTLESWEVQLHAGEAQCALLLAWGPESGPDIACGAHPPAPLGASLQGAAPAPRGGVGGGERHVHVHSPPRPQCCPGPATAPPSGVAPAPGSIRGSGASTQNAESEGPHKATPEAWHC